MLKIWRQRSITGHWRGRYEYDDAANAALAGDFVWDVAVESNGRLVGRSRDEPSDEEADLIGRAPGGRVELLKQYSTDPNAPRCVGEDGKGLSCMEVVYLPAWREALDDHNRTLRRNRQQTVDPARVAAELAEYLSRVEYVGRFVRRDRLEGTWLIRAFRYGLGWYESGEVKGSWWAERVGDPGAC